MNSGVEQVVNVSHTKPGYVRLFYGPLLLGYKGGSEITLSWKTKIIQKSNSDYLIKGEDVHLSPVYHLMDAKVVN